MADAWIYADWITYAEGTASEVAAKLARLRLHMQELAQAVTADVSAGSKSRSSGTLAQRLAELEKSEERLRIKDGRLSRGVYLPRRR